MLMVAPGHCSQALLVEQYLSQNRVRLGHQSGVEEVNLGGSNHLYKKKARECFVQGPAQPKGSPDYMPLKFKFYVDKYLYNSQYILVYTFE